tara:strand:- start:3642 stop:4439 length:798 start_codon:yes stop_codon:yes gene_type:complete
MAVTLQVKENKPPRIVIYGVEGVGKSTFGDLAPNPIFLPTEDGLASIDSPAMPLATTFKQFMGNIEELCTEDHDYQTAVIDSLDWLETLIHKQVAEEKGETSIEDIGYGKGYLFALDLWAEYIEAINYLRNEKNMIIVQVAHSEIKRFENPETDAYDRYNIKMHKKASEKIREHADLVLFANYYVGITKEESGFKKDGRKRAVGGKERVLYTTERPAATAKSRYNLPEEIIFDKEGDYWNVIAAGIPFLSNETKTKTKTKTEKEA